MSRFVCFIVKYPFKKNASKKIKCKVVKIRFQCWYSCLFDMLNQCVLLLIRKSWVCFICAVSHFLVLIYSLQSLKTVFKRVFINKIHLLTTENLTDQNAVRPYYRHNCICRVQHKLMYNGLVQSLSKTANIIDSSTMHPGPRSRLVSDVLSLTNGTN